MSHIENDPSTGTSGRAERRGVRRVHPACVLALSLLVLGTPILAVGCGAASQTASQESLPGIVSYTRIDANLAVGGALSLEAIPEIKRRGFKAVINLRKTSEPDANVEAEGVAVRNAGLKYVHLPFSATDPFEEAAAQVEPFMSALADPANLPALIHSRQAHRPVGMLVIQRVLQEGWSVEKGFAASDAQVLADGTPGAAGVRAFVLNYIKAHSR